MAAPLALPQLRRLCFSVLHELERQGYFQEALGYWCVDANDVPGTVGPDVGAWFLRKLGRDGIWPYAEHGEGYDADTLFDVLEAIHDLVSRPVEGRMHTFANCGMHYTRFNGPEGQMTYRQELNPVLARYEFPVEMNGRGEIVQAVPDEFAPLIAADVPAGTDQDLITSRLEAAKRAFRERHTTTADRRQAVRELADVLEAIRPDVKREMLSKDEGALFDLANNFAIRHNNREQARKYDDEIWLRWTFYVYLATIHAVLRVAARQQTMAAGE